MIITENCRLESKVGKIHMSLNPVNFSLISSQIGSSSVNTCFSILEERSRETEKTDNGGISKVSLVNFKRF